MGKNIQTIQFLRNATIVANRDAARLALETLTTIYDGMVALARYTNTSGQIATLAGIYAVSGETKSVTIIDVEGSAADVEALRQEINAKLGDGVTSANTVTMQLTALSGNSQSTSAETSIEGAKRYADELKNQMDYSGVTTGTGVYVTNVTQSDGIVSATTATLPSVSDTKEAKKVVVSVSEDKGQISIERGTISSSAETMVLTDNTDGGVNFEVNIDNNTIIQDAETKKLKVADAALVQYEGDTKTIAISPVQDGVRTVSSIITLSSITPSSTTVKEEYALKNASGETIGSTIKIYKDSSIVEINYITDPDDEHYQNLEYIYIDASGNTQTEYVDMSALVLEAEFASGVTFSDGVAHGVVDPSSETFLTVGTNGFKLSGVQDAIDDAVDGLDSTVSNSGNSGHVGVEIVEEDGKLVSVTVTEDDIASADDIEELSAKTVTEIASSNNSISATSASTTDGTVKYDIVTDADKIQMSGFSADSTSALSGIAESDSIATAFEKTNTVITDNERVTAEALTDLDNRINELSSGTTQELDEEIAARKAVDGISAQTYQATSTANYISGATSLNDADQKLDTQLKVVSDEYVSGATMNSNPITISNKVLTFTAVGSDSAGDGNGIVISTDNNGGLTFALGTLDAGVY